jgi:hypothetical protein
VIEVAILCGLFSVWFWAVLNDEEGIARPLTLLLVRTTWTKKWMSCPYCSGAWFAIIPSLLLYHDGWTRSIVTAFAAAAIAGLVGSNLAASE